MSQVNQVVVDIDETPAPEDSQQGDAHLSRPGQSANDAGPVDPADEVLEALNRKSANCRLEELEKEMQAAVHVAGAVALKGQTTMWFAGPNTGKTLLALKLVSDAKQAIGESLHIYHLNLDDDVRGLITKAKLGRRYGFEELDPEAMEKPAADFHELVDTLVEVKGAGRTLLILDTVKKFTDVMDKGRSSQFMTLCRRFTAAGGTIIALAHTNKHSDGEGKPVHGGTSDLVDDADCAYVMSIEREESFTGGVRRYVKFENTKARGDVARETTYSYEVNDDADYHRMFHSVKRVGEDEVEKARRRDQIKKDQLADETLIDTIRSLLSEQSWSQTALIDRVREKTGSSKRQVGYCLDRWSCAPDDGGLWIKEKGDNNASIYRLEETQQ